LLSVLSSRLEATVGATYRRYVTFPRGFKYARSLSTSNTLAVTLQCTTKRFSSVVATPASWTIPLKILFPSMGRTCALWAYQNKPCACAVLRCRATTYPVTSIVRAGRTARRHLHLTAHRFEPFDQAALHALTVKRVEMHHPKFLVYTTICEQMVHNHQNAMRYCDGGFIPTTPHR
jgi:hypothetical protein